MGLDKLTSKVPHASISQLLLEEESRILTILGRLFFFTAACALIFFGELINFMSNDLQMDLTDRYVASGIYFILGIISFSKKVPPKKWIPLSQALMFVFTIHSIWVHYQSGFNILYFITAITAIQLIFLSFHNDRLLLAYLIATLLTVLIICFVLPRKVSNSYIFFAFSVYLILTPINYVISLMTLNTRLKLRAKGLELKQQRSLFHSVVESSRDLVWAIDKDFKLLTFNKRYSEVFESMYADSPQEGLDLRSMDRQKEYKIDWVDHYIKALEGQRVSFTSNIFLEGQETWFEFSMGPISEGNNKLGISIFGRDVSLDVLHAREKKDMEKALVNSEERYALAMEGSNDGLWDWDLANKHLFLSPRLKQILGLEHQEEYIPAEVCLSWIHPDDRDGIHARFFEHLKGKSPNLIGDFRIQHKDGHYVWVMGKGRATFDKKGKPKRLTGFLSDITQRKRDEEWLRFLSLVASQTDNGVMIADKNGLVEWVNDGFTKISGYSLDEIQGKKPGDLLQGPLSDQKVVSQMGEKIRAGVTFTEEIINYNKAGEPYWVSIQLTPIFDQKGQIDRYIAIESDITAQKEYEAVLRKAKEDAEAAAVAKAEFLATMSHEIRTPMNAVIGMTGLLLDSRLSEEQREFVETIRISGDNLLTVINDILDFSKIDSGKLELEAQGFTLEEAIEDVLDLLGTKAHDKGLELAYDLDTALPEQIISDPTRISQILVNLINNAIKFTAQGEVILKIEAVSEPENAEQFIQFAVRDTGIGIPKEKIDRLFKSFSQVDASTTRKYGGTGLGLAICKKLVEMMGGNIWIESEEGVGSTFFFTLKVQVARPQARPTEPQALAGKKVLLVDDNLTNLKILQRQCKNWALVPVCLNHPEEVAPYLREVKDIDLVILDMQMPGLDGIQVARQIRASYTIEELPMIMLTSMGFSVPEEDRSLFNAFLTKPVRRKMLHKYILQSLFHSSAESNQRTYQKQSASDKHEPIEGLRILLAEDNVVNQKVALRILGKLGYEAEIASNGIEAIEAIERKFYDVIFMDMQMPQMDGLTATETIRNLPLPYEIPPRIIAMTANALKGDREKCIEAGMDDYISKPVKTEHIRHMIEKWFGSQVKKMEKSTEPRG